MYQHVSCFLLLKTVVISPMDDQTQRLNWMPLKISVWNERVYMHWFSLIFVRFHELTKCIVDMIRSVSLDKCRLLALQLRTRGWQKTKRRPSWSLVIFRLQVERWSNGESLSCFSSILIHFDAEASQHGNFPLPILRSTVLLQCIVTEDWNPQNGKPSMSRVSNSRPAWG